MQTPSISIYGAAAAVLALPAALLWYLSAQRFRMASTGQELLDLFEDRQAMLEERATSTSSNDEDEAHESATAAAALDLTPKANKLASPSARCFCLGRRNDRPPVVSRLDDRRREECRL